MQTKGSGGGNDSDQSAEEDLAEFDERHDQIIAFLKRPFGVAQNVKVIFREQVVAATKRCYICAMIIEEGKAPRVKCTEVACPQEPAPTPSRPDPL